MAYFIGNLRTFRFLNSYFMRNRYYSLLGSSLYNSKHLSLIHPNVYAGNVFPTFSVHLIPLPIAQIISPPPWSLPQLLQPTEMYFSELQHLLYNHLLKVAQSCPSLCNLKDYTVHGILQARILECVAFPFSRGSSQPRDQIQVSCIAGRFFTN